MKKIMFLCKHNSFRSKVAEAVFKKLYIGNKIKVISRGIFPGPFIYPNTKKSVKEVGYVISGKPRGITFNELRNQDKIIIVANDVPISLIKNYKSMKDKVFLWKIPDSDAKETEKIKRITKEIEHKVKLLIKEIK